MNYLGHAHVALATGRDDPRFVLGAVLPDLASMAGVRLRRHRLDGPLADGVRCHVEADAAFHGHRAFLEGTGAMRRRLTAAGLASGPARAVAHIGWELLLDGTLLGSPAEEAYWRSLDWGEEVHRALDGDDRRRWARLLEHRVPRPRLCYDEPGWVAARVQAILDRRPRLRFPEDHLPAVVPVLAEGAGQVRSVAGRVLGNVALA